MDFTDLNTQFQRPKVDIDSLIQRTLEHDYYSLFPEVAELEEKMAA